ncbi:MAG: helix-turn-helix transcriptional regulator [Bdellovibrionota bacterium]
MKQRGRPKGQSSDRRSFGPLGDLIRNSRLSKGLGLADVAKACNCSVQFVSNIEHGRAPLPWDKINQLAAVLKVTADELQAANLAVRSDFRSFVNTARGKRPGSQSVLGKKVAGTASAVALAAKDSHLQEIIQKYNTASTDSRKRFVRAALQMLN